MNDGIDRIDTFSDEPDNQVLREYGAERIGRAERADYDLVVEKDGEEYGIEADSIAAAQADLNESLENSRVYLTRESRGSRSGRVLSNDLEGEMTVEEAARPLKAD